MVYDQPGGQESTTVGFGILSARVLSRLGAPNPTPWGAGIATWPSFTIKLGATYLYELWVRSDNVTRDLHIEVDRGDGSWFEIDRIEFGSPPPLFAIDVWHLLDGFSFVGLGTTSRVRVRAETPDPAEVINQRFFADNLILTEFLDVAQIASQVAICNLALSRIQVKERIAALTEDSSEASECDLIYDTLLDEALGAPKDGWPWAKVRKTLVAHAGLAPDQWGFHYVYPADCVRALYIINGLQEGLSRPTDEIVYRVHDDGAGTKVIYTDADLAELVYVQRVTDPTKYPMQFTMYFAWLLASELAQPLASSLTLEQRAVARAQIAYEKAIAHSYGEESEPQEPDDIYVSNR